MPQPRLNVPRKDVQPGRQDQAEDVSVDVAESTEADIVAQTDELLDEIDALGLQR